MNLADVLNLPEKQWTPDGDHVYAKIVGIKPYEPDGNYGFKQPVQLADTTGDKANVVIQTKYEEGLVTSAHNGCQGMWRLKWWGDRSQRKHLVGYCTTKLPKGGIPQAAQQSPQNAPQSTNSRKLDNGEPNWDAIAEGKVRHGIVCAILSSGKKPLYSYVKEVTEFVMTGEEPTGVAGAMTEQSDTSACPECGKYFPDCDCKPAF